MNKITIKYITTITDYITAIKELTNHPILSCDIETYILPQYKGMFQKALSPHHSGISTIQLKPITLDIVYIFDVLILERLNYDSLSLLNLLKTRSTLIIHNASFEAKFFRKYWGVYFNNLWCTRVASQLIANAFGSKFIRSASAHTLEMLCLDYLNIRLIGKRGTQIEDWYPRPLTQKKLEYAASDVIYLEELKKIFEDIILTPAPDIDNPTDPWGLDMGEILDLEMQFINLEAECEYNGLPINKQALSLFEKELCDKKEIKGELYKIAGELCQLLNLSTQIPLSLDIDYTVPTEPSLKTLNSSQQLTPLINTYIGKANTSEGKVVQRILDLLEVIKNDSNPEYCSEDEEKEYKELEDLMNSEVIQRHRTAQLLIQYKTYAKQANMRMSKYVHAITGRIHYSLNSLGASTGRTSSSNP